MLTVAARPSPKAAIAFVAYMRKNARRLTAIDVYNTRLTRKVVYNVDAYTKIFRPDFWASLRIALP